MIATFPSLTALLFLVVGFFCSTNAVAPSSLLRTKHEVATLHRDALIDAVHKKARKLVDTTSEHHGILGDGETFCSFIEEEMSFEDIDEDVSGDCTCSGTITDTLEVTCSFQNICGVQGDICGSVNATIKISNLVDAEGNFGSNPEIELQACVDVDIEGLEEMCITLNFAGVDFVPVNCTFTYDAQMCECNVNSVVLDEQFDIEVPCLVWNCSEVVPEVLKPYMAEDTCDVFSSTENETVSAVDPALTSFAALEEIPADVTSELEGGSGAFSNNKVTGFAASFLALSAAFFM
jgi:translation initiation factor 1 (eIF-1/SUI1)